MKRATRARRKIWAAGGVAALWLLGATAAQAQFFPFFGAPERPARPAAPPPAPRTLSPGQIRAILAQEGAHPVGKAKLRGQDLIVIGVGDEGARKRFTLDAFSGEILDITVLARREEPPPANLPPGEPLPPPDHAPDRMAPVGQDLPPPGAPTAPDVSSAAVKPTPVSPNAPATTEAAAPAPKKSDPADAALSPIRPLRPSGAPKVEPMPN